MSGFMEWNLGCLRALAALRSPVLDAVMGALTELGGELLFMVLMLVIFWCVDKNKGYYLMLLCFFGTAVNQALKISFCIPRPWVLDPRFEIVESARAGATGFSFPSGHTQNAVGAYGGLARVTKRRGVRVVGVLLALLIPFSRMYLGVHTPLDVGVSFLLAWAMVFAFAPLLEELERRPAVLLRAWLGMLLPAVLFLVYALRVRAGAAGDLTNFDHAVKTAWTMLGLVLGAVVSVCVDQHYTRFETAAVWWAQLLKVALGLGLMLAVRAGLKAPLTALFGANSIGDGIRYFLMVVAGGTLWPMTFGYFALLGRRR